jgi:glycosyltransferase involved in cell wall biosynthesis
MGFMPQFFKPFAKEIPWTETKDFHKVFAEQNWDIGIMVAQDNLFNRVKSNLKYLEYGSVKCAAIGHAVYPYTNTIEDGVDGLLVYKEKTDWKKHIYRLIEDEPYRLELAENAYKKVSEQYTFEGDHQRLEDLYIEIFDYLGV